MAEQTNLYTEDSIVTETSREFTRRVPSTYLGSSKKNTNLIKEIFANAVDEHKIGHGNKIDIIVDTSKNQYIVEDNGQGFIVNGGIDEDGETILQRSFDKINTSGKTTEDGVYNGTALGLNGIGAKLTNWLSKELIVTTYRDGEFETLWFEDGLFKKRKVGKANHQSGTIVEWHPDEQFFAENIPDVEGLNKHFEIISALCPQLTINFTYNGKTKTFNEPEGINAYVGRKIEHKEIFKNRFLMERSIGKDSINICITYTKDYSENIEAYVNLGQTTDGEHIKIFHTSFVKAVNRYANDTGLLKKNDKNFTNAEISEGLYVVCNITTTTAKYDAQNKSRIDDIDGKIITSVIGGDFATWLMNNPDDAKLIVEKALTARKAREAAQKAKEKIRDAGNVNKKSIFVDLPSKLSDAYPKNKRDRSNCELYITEGDSAASSINAVKNSEFQACFPIRGKVLNCQKATPDKVYANAEISNITKALGLDIDKASGKLIFDENKIRYNKIIFATDEDADGYDISLLLLTVFNWLCPELIEKGYIYRVHGALFKATFNDGTYVTFQTDAELEKFKKTNKKPYKLTRAKGLGELTSDETYEQLVNPATRDLRRLIVNDVNEFNKYLEIFEGNDVTPRKDYLEQHSKDYDE